MTPRQDSSTEASGGGSPFALTNIRLFIAFRVLFNARFYYPVFTVLFLDYGLTLEQFALLNTVWAVTIVLAEVPSGALADVFGRKRLLVATAVLMVIEMALIAFVPLGNGRVIFLVFFTNRVLSGLGEALASGADEALAYDTLVAHNMAVQWPRVLDWQMRIQNAGFIVAMAVGAAVYDNRLANGLFAWFGLDSPVSREMSMRMPVFLTLGFALLAVWIALR
ncbi:MAG: MFS transporter, partial [Desulfobulbus sp.]|nr:MFS transporter [Desulfobulbus sp.]